MTRVRPLSASRGSRLLVTFGIAAAATAFLLGCAPSTATVPPAATPSPSDCVVAANPHADPPEGCLTYDPEANMALNDAYRDRYPVGDDVVKAGAGYVESVTVGLDDLRTSASVTVDGVRAVLVGAGLPAEGVQTLGDTGSVAFGAILPAEVAATAMAVCLFGEVGPDRVDVEVGGLVMDGGCLAGPGGH